MLARRALVATRVTADAVDRSASTSYRRDAATVAAVLAAVIGIVFAPFLVGGGTLMMASHDVASIYPTGAVPGERPTIIARVQRTFDYSPGWQDEPDVGVEHRLWRGGSLPFWNPYQGLGAPLAAAMQPQPFFPLRVLEALHPGPTVHDWFVVARLFVAGFFAGAFVLLFAGRAAAVTASVACAFTGYFGSYYDMPHLSVETLLPALLWATELVVRRPNASRTALLAAIAGLDVLGGMPESTLLAYTVAGAYAAVRVCMLRRDGRVVGRIIALAGAGALGAALAAVVVLPFVEYLPQSYDTHQPANTGGAFVGLAVDACLPQCLVQHIAPLAFGPPWNNILTGFDGQTDNQGGFGLVVIWLGLLATFRSLGALAARRARALDGVVVFLACVTFLLIAKRFGFPPVQWIGALPGYRLVVFLKYAESPAGVCAAMLAGFGVDALRRALAEARRYPLVDVLVLALAAFAYAAGRNAVPPEAAHAGYFYGAIALTIGAFAVAIGARELARRGTVSARAAIVAVMSCVAIEATGSYMLPMLYVATTPQPPANPYADDAQSFIATIAPPLERDHMRVLGAYGIFFGNWAGSFGLRAVNSVDAMYPHHFLRFVADFSPPSAQVNDLSGNNVPDLGSDLGRRWLALSSIEYIVEPRHATPPLQPTSLLAHLWDQNADRVGAADLSRVNLGTMRTAGITKLTLFEHPPYDGITYRTRVDARAPIFAVDAAIAPSAYLEHDCAAPVAFRLEASDAAGVPIAVRRAYLDPKRRAADRGWTPLRIDLSRFAGREVVLRFGTAPGPAHDLCNAWAHWGDPRFVDASGRGVRVPPRSPFEVHARRDATILRYRDAMPRATIARDVRSVATDADAGALLRSPSFDVRHAIVVARDPGVVVPSVHASCAGGNDRLTFAADRPERVAIDATLACDGVVVLHDTWFPGWVARVDGADAPVLRADETLRAVAVPAGSHRVVFSYESRAVRAGELVSCIAAIAIVLLPFAGRVARLGR